MEKGDETNYYLSTEIKILKKKSPKFPNQKNRGKKLVFFFFQKKPIFFRALAYISDSRAVNTLKAMLILLSTALLHYGTNYLV